MREIYVDALSTCTVSTRETNKKEISIESSNRLSIELIASVICQWSTLLRILIKRPCLVISRICALSTLYTEYISRAIFESRNHVDLIHVRGYQFANEHKEHKLFYLFFLFFFNLFQIDYSYYKLLETRSLFTFLLVSFINQYLVRSEKFSTALWSSRREINTTAGNFIEISRETTNASWKIEKKKKTIKE